MEKKFNVGDLVDLPPSLGAFIGKVAEVDGPRVRIDWNGGELVTGAVGDWLNADALRLRKRGPS